MNKYRQQREEMSFNKITCRGCEEEEEPAKANKEGLLGYKDSLKRVCYPGL